MYKLLRDLIITPINIDRTTAVYWICTCKKTSCNAAHICFFLFQKLCSLFLNLKALVVIITDAVLFIDFTRLIVISVILYTPILNEYTVYT